MRFDNPIYDHGFVFPDIADFPDVVDEPKYKGNGNEQSVAIMKEAIQKNDLNMFQNGYQYYMKSVDTKLSNKLNTMFQFYASFEDNRIELEDLYTYISDSGDKTKLAQQILDSKEQLELNHRLMQLHDVDISGHSKTSIMESVRRPIPTLAKPKFLSMILEDTLNMNIKNPELWLKDSFGVLNSFAGNR